MRSEAFIVDSATCSAAAADSEERRVEGGLCGATCRTLSDLGMKGKPQVAGDERETQRDTVELVLFFFPGLL